LNLKKKRLKLCSKMRDIDSRFRSLSDYPSQQKTFHLLICELPIITFNDEIKNSTKVYYKKAYKTTICDIIR
jgi:hypothetical protein